MLRAASPRTNGSSMARLRSLAMPGPSSSTSITANVVPARSRTITSAAEPHRILDQVGHTRGADRRAAP